MAKIPPPEDVTNQFSKFQPLKDSELEDMRNFLKENKNILNNQYREFE